MRIAVLLLKLYPKTLGSECEPCTDKLEKARSGQGSPWGEHCIPGREMSGLVFFLVS